MRSTIFDCALTVPNNVLGCEVSSLFSPCAKIWLYTTPAHCTQSGEKKSSSEWQIPLSNRGFACNFLHIGVTGMGNELNYYKPVQDEKGAIYSCDMVRLKFHIGNHISQTFLNYLNRLETVFSFRMDYYKNYSLKIGTYRHLFTCKYDSFTFVIGCGLILAGESSGMDCFIEFNPNKCDMNYMFRILDRIRVFLKPVDNEYFRLIRWDLAVDIPFPRSDVVLFKKGKREYSKTISSSVTEYLGNRNTNGFVKVYDKTAESDLYYDLTRIEVTCDSFDSIVLPEVYVLGRDYDDFGLNDTDKVMLRLLRGVDFETQQQCLKDMGRGKAQKLKPYLFPEDNKYQFNVNCIDIVILGIKDILCCGRDNHLRFGILDDVIKKKSEGMSDDEVFEQLSLFD